MPRSLLTFVLGAFLSAAADASAQTGTGGSTSAGEALRDTFLDGPIIDADELIDVLQSQIATFPIGSSAGGFTWGFDPQLGMQIRQSRSFGPMFADRPHTNGRFKLTVNFAHQRTTWQAINGEDLAEGLVTSFVTAPDDGLTGDPESLFARTTLALETERTVAGATFGLTDRIDIGVLIPYGRSSVTGATDSIIRNLENGRIVVLERYRAAGESSGFGDLTLRGKVNVISRPSYALAGGADVRLPTGSADKLLGSGSAQVRVMAIGSLTRNDATPHFNVGYTFAPGRTTTLLGSTARRDEFNYAIGADVAVNTRVTVAGDFTGRTLLNAVDIIRETSENYSSLVSTHRNVHLLIGAIGAKVLVGQTWLMTGSLAFPLTENGIKPGLTPMIGFERAF